MYPDYRGAGIVNLMASVINACGGRADAYAPLQMLDVQPLDGVRKLVLLVLDGLGYAYLTQQGAGSALHRQLRTRLTSVAPPTTATAITTFLTGQAPQQHGLTGWFTWFRELGSVLAVLPFAPRCGGRPLGGTGVSAAALFGHVPLFDRLPVKSASVCPEWIAHSEFNRAHLGRAELLPYRDLDQCFSSIARAVRSTDAPGYVYAYWPGFDRLAHELGVASDGVSEHFAALDAGFARLLDRLARFMVLRRAGKSQEITHAHIVRAIEAGDPDAARRALLEDIESARDAILDGVMEEEAAAWHLDTVY